MLKQTFEEIYRKQGLEFSQFIRDGDAADAIDKSLIDIVDRVVDRSQVIPEHRTKVKYALVSTVREIVYNGSAAQLEVLFKFSSTYLLLFLLQYDPKLVSYFECVTEQLVIYVDTSILIPAMSEYFLDAKNQRYSNLLKSANDAGVKLYVTETVLSELSAHFYNLKQTYNRYYFRQEKLFEDLEFTPFVPEILLRSYFYAKSRQMVTTFEDFYSCFTTLADAQRERELYNWIHDAYGISFQNYSNLAIEIDPYLEEELFEKLKDTKNSPQQARNDVKQLLMIYALRDKNNEVLDSGAFGYKTWWLTSDTKSQRAFREIGGTGRHKNPYIRADFLYNFLTLAPSRAKVNAVFQTVFPNLLGVNISFHVPDEIGVAIREQMLQHSELVNRPGFRGKLSILLEDLMGSPRKRTNIKSIRGLSSGERERAQRSGLIFGNKKPLLLAVPCSTQEHKLKPISDVFAYIACTNVSLISTASMRAKWLIFTSGAICYESIVPASKHRSRFAMPIPSIRSACSAPKVTKHAKQRAHPMKIHRLGINIADD